MQGYNVPEGWLDYTAFRQPIRGTQIIPIKTPLKSKFNSSLRKVDSPPYVRGTRYRGGVPLEEEFTPQQLVHQLRSKLRKRLSAVIDLTFTCRYYDSKEFSDMGVQYTKVKCPGREIPSEAVYSEFKRVLSGFLESCDESSLVAVHCTHGLNRTGYLVCRYLVEQSGRDATTAIKDFNEARGHEIERANYLQHLQDRCHYLKDTRDTPGSHQGSSVAEGTGGYQHRLVQNEVTDGQQHTAPGYTVPHPGLVQHKAVSGSQPAHYNGFQRQHYYQRPYRGRHNESDCLLLHQEFHHHKGYSRGYSRYSPYQCYGRRDNHDWS